MYGTKAIIPLEVGLPTLRTSLVKVGNNDEALKEALDFAESKKEVASVHLENYQNVLARQRKGQINPREFQVVELVLQKTLGTTVHSKHGNLGQN